MEAGCSSKAQRLSSNTINTLPQTIIETILCLLPIEEAARTSILSREWRYKWTKIPKLVFRYDTVYERPTETEQVSYMARARNNMNGNLKLFYAIHQVLLLRQGPIHEFTLVMEADCHFFEIDQILLHLSSNHTVKKLKLDLDYPEDYRNWYKLPFCAFSMHQLTDLDLNYIDLNHQPTTFGGFVNLRSLCLKNVTISTKALLHLLSSSPSLKRFTLLTEAEDIGYKNCTIAKLFKCLPVIEHLTTWDNVFSWLVVDSVSEHGPTSVVHLKYLCFNRLCFADGPQLSTLLAVLIRCSPNLEKLKLEIDFEWSYGHANEESSAILKKMYSDVRLAHLKELEILGFGNSKLEMEFVKIILARSPKLKKLTIVSVVDDKQESEMLKVLLRSPRASPVEIVVISYQDWTDC